MEKDTQFVLPAEFNRGHFLAQLAGCYITQQEPVSKENYVYYDTFDWRLFHASLVLFGTPKALFLQSLHNHRILQTVACPLPPAFVGDIPEGGLKEQIAPIIEVRALLRLLAIRSRLRGMRILNRDHKTVARLVFAQNKILHPQGARSLVQARSLATRLWLRPVRGYGKEARSLSRWLGKKGFHLSPENFYLQALKAANKNPGEYSAKLHFRFDPAMRADEATKVVVKFLLGVIKSNEDGVKENIDTEFLHDWRVAIRRTRCALGEIKNVFPVDLTEQFKKDFSFLAKETNRLRDLDVFLLQKDGYKERLPAQVGADLDPLFAHLQQERAEALNTLVEVLRSKEYANILRRWQEFLDQPPADCSLASQAARPIHEIAFKRIAKRCRGVMKLGRQLRENSEDQTLHALRIEGKKLRYLLEFFSSLFPDQQVIPALKCLRKLQDHLGRWHDLSVQKETLQRFAATVCLADPQVGKTLRAIDNLRDILEGEKQTLQHEFPEVLTNLAS